MNPDLKKLREDLGIKPEEKQESVPNKNTSDPKKIDLNALRDKIVKENKEKKKT